MDLLFPFLAIYVQPSRERREKGEELRDSYLRRSDSLRRGTFGRRLSGSRDELGYEDFFFE